MCPTDVSANDLAFVGEACDQGRSTPAEEIENTNPRLSILFEHRLHDFRWEAGTVGMEAV